MLKSLIDWEKSRRESQKFGKTKQNEGALAEDSVSDFEKEKAHKSTSEDSTAEVTN